MPVPAPEQVDVLGPRVHHQLVAPPGTGLGGGRGAVLPRGPHGRLGGLAVRGQDEGGPDGAGLLAVEVVAEDTLGGGLEEQLLGGGVVAPQHQGGVELGVCQWVVGSWCNVMLC